MVLAFLKCFNHTKKLIKSASAEGKWSIPGGVAQSSLSCHNIFMSALQNFDRSENQLFSLCQAAHKVREMCSFKGLRMLIREAIDVQRGLPDAENEGLIFSNDAEVAFARMRELYELCREEVLLSDGSSVLVEEKLNEGKNSYRKHMAGLLFNANQNAGLYLDQNRIDYFLSSAEVSGIRASTAIMIFELIAEQYPKVRIKWAEINADMLRENENY